MGKNDKFYQDMQRHIAVTAIGPSALRNQGASGVIKNARSYLAEISLKGFRTKDEQTFLKILDKETQKLQQKFPQGAQNWGAARKALNLFLRDVFYNQFLCRRYELNVIEEWLEIPLDGVVAKFLIKHAREELSLKQTQEKLPSWDALKRLKQEDSAKFQAFAKLVATQEGISRIHLDMLVWTTERKN